MASNLKVDIVRPTATNGSLSLKGDSGGSATTNGVTVNSSGNTSITGTTTVSSLVATTADINGGTIDDATIGGTTPAVGNFTQVNADNLRLDASTISSTNTDGNINLSPNGNGSTVVTSGGTGDALRITQTGAGNALVVEDYTSPDSTPFVVDGTGRLLVGTSSSFQIENTITPQVISANSTSSGACADLFVGSFQNAGGSGRSRVSGKLFLAHSRSGTSGSIGGLVGNGDRLGEIRFVGDDGTQFLTAAEIVAGVDGTPSTNDMPGFLAFSTTADGGSTPTERLRIESNGTLLVGKTAENAAVAGFQYRGDAPGLVQITRSSGEPLQIYRYVDDGKLIRFLQDGVEEGYISISGTTVSYIGGNLARLSQLPDDSKDESIVKGTVMTNLDVMCEWYHPDEYWTEEDELPDGVSVGDLKNAAYTEENEQLNRMAVSSVEGDPNVAGVFVNWDNDDDKFNDMNIAMTGDMVIRIAQNVVVNRGDLLMSAGDGTAKPQEDDIVRSKTIAKVTSTHVSKTYPDGSYLVPCVLMAC